MYKNYLLAILSGLIFALSWPTYGFSFLIFIAWFPILLAAYNVQKSNAKRQNFHVFSLAFLTFLVWNIITTWWIWNSTPAGGVFAIVVNSLLMTIVFFLYHLIAKRKPVRFSLIFFVSFWIVFEKFHYQWEFSWPWLTLGNVFSENTQWIQWYEWTGVFGGSLWILLVNMIVFNAWVYYQTHKQLKLLIKNLLLGFSIVVLGIFISKYIDLNYTTQGTSFSVVVLQPNTDPYTEKYHQSLDAISSELVSLAQPQMNDSVRFVLAPETVFSTKSTKQDFESSRAFQKLNHFQLSYPKAAFLSGVDLYEIFSKSVIESKTANHFSNSKEAWYESYNAAIFVNLNQKPSYYYKSKLVVGVEHFPYRSVLEPLLGKKMIDLGGSVSTLTPQKTPSVFKHPYAPVTAAPIICYESIYGEYLGAYTQRGANFLAIITNDSWWGNTQGHKQLLSYAKLRAIEQRRSIARSANSGISAFINSKGEIISSLPYLTKGALRGEITTNDRVTFYAKNGDYIARIALLVSVLFLLVGFFVVDKKEV